MSKKCLKPVPYMVQQDSYPSKQFAQWLREKFKPLLAKRLPTVLYGGFKHGFIPNFIQKHKKTHPYFVKVDIEKFYPSLSHHHLRVEAQMAYKNLLGLRYVPKAFKNHFLPGLDTYLDALLLQDQGISLNSGVSKALAPLIYVEFFLYLKKQEDIKFIVFVDDIVMLASTKRAVTAAYIGLFNYLKSVELSPNLGKVQQGSFSTSILDYCGYRFAGGYVGISTPKIRVFKEKINLMCANYKLLSEAAFIKKINQSINGFGHYYKYGNVRGVYEKLDSYIRTHIYNCYALAGRKRPRKSHLSTKGLRSLLDIISLVKPIKKTSLKRTASLPRNSRIAAPEHFGHVINYLEKLTYQNSEIIGKLSLCVKELQELNRTLSGC